MCFSHESARFECFLTIIHQYIYVVMNHNNIALLSKNRSQNFAYPVAVSTKTELQWKSDMFNIRSAVGQVTIIFTGTHISQV